MAIDILMGSVPRTRLEERMVCPIGFAPLVGVFEDEQITEGGRELFDCFLK